MPSILLTPPAIEPLSLAEAKDYLRVEHTDDDALIAALIAGARAHVEAQTRRALITQTWRHNRDAWPRDGRIEVPPAPLQALAAARVYDEEGMAQPIELESFIVDTIAAPGVISFPPWSVPAPGQKYGGIELDIVVGYGATANDVPEPLRLAIKALLSHWYDNRGVAAERDVSPLPWSVAVLIATYRVLSL
jgi:uncharacterized phiE125 gp8 family phage protein